MIEIHVSIHAKRRLRKRLGIPYKAAKRYVSQAFKEGELVQSLRNKKCALVEYQNNYFIFGLNSEGEPTLVTAYRRAN